jgi:hypothetical protein
VQNGPSSKPESNPEYVEVVEVEERVFQRNSNELNNFLMFLAHEYIQNSFSFGEFFEPLNLKFCNYNINTLWRYFQISNG